MNHPLKQGLLIILSAPAGTGKTTLVKRIVNENPNILASVSFTTRPKRELEVDGIDYSFVNQEQFKSKIEADDFLEHVEFCGNYYGTSRSWVDEQRQKGKHVILTIDTQGGLLLKNKVDAVYIFVLPPSLEIQRQRLVNRKTDSMESIEKRLKRTALELHDARQYDYVIVNDNLDNALDALKSIILAEEHRTQRMLNDPACPQLLKS